jgi:YD repeat-containing protein
VPGTWFPGFTTCWDEAGYHTGYFASAIINSDPAVTWSKEKIGAFDAQGTWQPEPPPAMSCPVGHPVQPATGVKVLTETDLALPDATLRYQRTYRSTLFGSPAQGPGGWISEWQRKLFFQDSDNASMPRVVARRQDGEAVFFDPNVTTHKWYSGNGKDALQASYDASGVIVSWQYTVSGTGAVETYDSAGRLVSIREHTGRTTTLSYDTNGQLKKVTAPSGRSLTFAYNAQGRVSSITAPDGAITQYAYNANGMLTTVTWPDNTTRQYVYEDTRFPTALTGVIDEAGVRYATYAYDDQGRAITSELTAGADRYQFQYQANGQTTVLTPDGGSSTYSFLKQNGVLLPTGVSAPCPLCGNTALSTSYDSNNNATSKTGYDGSTTSYTYDTLGRETQRIEGAGTANAKTTTTEWDPQQWLVTRVAAPNKIEAFSYDANGNLLSHTVTPTGDANGSQGFGAAASGDANRIEWTSSALRCKKPKSVWPKSSTSTGPRSTGS